MVPITIAILSGFLCNELRDFFLEGGWESKFAFKILKINFITLFIFVLTMIKYFEIDVNVFDGCVKNRVSGVLTNLNGGDVAKVEIKPRSISKRRNRFKSDFISMSD